MPTIIKKGEPIDKPQWRKWTGMNGARESAQLLCPFCKTTFALKKYDPVVVRNDCLDSKGVIIRYFVQCPCCKHRANHDRIAMEPDAA